jgi:hypothetical protein
MWEKSDRIVVLNAVGVCCVLLLLVLSSVAGAVLPCSRSSQVWATQRGDLDLGWCAGKSLMLNGVETGKASSVGQSLSDSDGREKTIYVDDNNTLGPWDGSLEFPYQYVQDAVANSSDGDTIFLFNGRYFTNTLFINKSITMIGEARNSTWIIQPQMFWISVITADHVTIQNLTLWQATNEKCGGGVSIRGDYFSMINCHIFASGAVFFGPFGLIMKNVSHITIQGIEMSSRGFNIGISNCQDVIVCDSIIYAFDSYNIWALNSTDMVISHNLIEEGMWSIVFQKCNGNVIINNTLGYTISQNIYLEYSSDNIITGNDLGKVWFNNSKNTWNGNYWRHPRMFPKLIFGEQTVLGHRFPDFQVDWHPLRQPQSPGVGS